ncbi:MAG: TetR/AcrR family transcriptional regulator [Clostridia bacterium]|nr:TetR/AcrR family transcriptional regulator [Clostridia bacterium]
MDTQNLSGLDLPEKEHKILEAAIKVFSEKGFSAATTSEIAKNAGIAEGTIFRYFKTKKDILRGILVHTINIISGKLVLSSIEKILAASDGKDVRTILKEVLYDRLKLVDSVFPMARVILTESLFHDDVREAIYQNIISPAVEMFKVFLAKAIERGMIRDDIDPEIVLRSIMGNAAVFIAQRKLFSDKFLMEDMDKELDKLIDVIMYGIAVKNPDYIKSDKDLT